MTGAPRIGVVVPARDEAALLPACLDGLDAARRAVADRADVRVLVVLDDCRDASAAVVARRGVDVLTVVAGRVGTARAAGCRALLAEGVAWLAGTDADSVVPPGWLVEHLEALAEGCDALVGTVRVDAWEDRPVRVRARHDAIYAPGDAAGHPHVHGTNLGIAARAYRRAGGFAPLATGEDVALVEALERSGASIRRTRTVPVRTSARRGTRARSGFGDHLSALEAAP